MNIKQIFAPLAVVAVTTGGALAQDSSDLYSIDEIFTALQKNDAFCDLDKERVLDFVVSWHIDDANAPLSEEDLAEIRAYETADYEEICGPD